MPYPDKPISRPNGFSSLKNQVQLGAVITSAASLAVVGTVIVLISFNFQRTRLELWLKEMNQRSTFQIESYFNDLIREVDHLGRIPGLTELPHESQQQILQGVIRLNKAYESAVLLDRQGQVLTSASHNGSITRMDFSKNNGFVYAFNRKELYISSIILRQDSTNTTKEYLIVSTPVRNKQDGVDGVAFVRINLDFLKFVVSQIEVGQTGQAFVLDERDFLIACSSCTDVNPEISKYHSNRLSDYPVLKLLYRNKENKGKLALQYTSFMNTDVIGNIDFIRPVYWKMIIEIPVAEADALTYRMIRILVIALGVIIICMILLSVLFVKNRILTPLEKMMSVSQSIINGSLDTQVSINSPMEFKLLANTFNTMLGTLSHRIAFENFIINVSNRFINFEPQNIATLIRQSLEEINIFFNTDLVFFHYFQEERNQKEFYFASRDPNPHSLNELFCSPYLGCHWYKEKVRLSLPVSYTSHEELPAEAQQLQAILKAQQITSLLHIPVTTMEMASGILGIHTFRHEKNWDQHDLVLMRVLAEIFLNVFEQQKIKSELMESELKYKELTDTLPHVVFESDPTGKLTFANQYALQLLGYSQDEIKQGINLQNIFAAESWENVSQAMQLIMSGSKPLETEYIAKKKNGALFPILMHPVPVYQNKTIIGMRGVMLDLTERKKTEEEMLKMQKLESIGILSGGIAHDFNNILSSIIGNISLAKFSMQEQHNTELEEILNDAQTAGLRARELTHQLLTFSKGGSPIKKVGSIAQVVLETARFCLRGSNVEFELNTASDLWRLEFDEGQICQVVNNLLINAKQAMPEGGKISIYIENVVTRLPAHFLPQRGHYIKIIVKDTGPGIPEAIIDKIFDPYFTTKQSGSGLGLTTVYSIIKQHHGFIDVTSAGNEGACFTIYLPALDHAPEKEPLQDDRQYNFYQHKHLLVMDDDQDIRKTITSILNSLGYKVDVAEEGAEALAKYKQAFIAKKCYDAVILDLTVPKGMGGKEAVKLLRNFDKNLRAVVSSGYSNDPVMSAYKEHGFDAILTKPFTVEDLGRVLAHLFEDDKKLYDEVAEN